MAEILLTASAEVLLKKLLSPETATLMKKLFGCGKKYLKMMEEWKSELSNIKALLVDAERQQCSSEEVKKWLEDLQDVAFDMEDVLGDFEIQIQDCQISMANASGVIGSLKIKAKEYLKIKPKNPDKMDSIIERLQSIQSRREAMGLSKLGNNMQHDIPLTNALRSKRETTSTPSKENFFGRDEEKQRIVNELLKSTVSDEKYGVIPIVGNGGIGKTKLAHDVYNDAQFDNYFDIKAWVCVSDVFDVKSITTSIYREVTGSEGPAIKFKTLQEAQKYLNGVIKQKKFFIVLDDIWNQDNGEWQNLQTPFENAAKESRILMTTRNKGIARMMMNTNSTHENIIELGRLSDDDCWCVFQQNAKNDPELDELRDDIIEKCKGLPLAAKVLGGIMKQKVGKQEYQMVLNNDSWTNEENNVLSILRLSYHYLPPHLKRVFAYCSVLHKDYVFEKREIILLWMAQGFLLEKKEECMEALGESYFEELISRSLFEFHEDGFVMHDLIHDLAQSVAGKVCCVMGKKVDDWQRIRHVFVTKDGRTTLESPPPMASQWRTVYCEAYYVYIENLKFIEDLRYVRTLGLSSRTIEVLPECIGDLQHLRLLSLHFHGLKELPASINKLWNLQTLCLKDCCKLVKIPNISSLGKLRYMEIEETSLREMPMGLEKLTNLHSLDNFILGHRRGDKLSELKELNHLEGKLRICGLENVTMSKYARKAQLHGKTRLDELHLEWGNENDEVDDVTKKEVVEQLKPHDSIKECMLKGFKGLALPSWLGDPCFNNMVNVSLIDCAKCERLPSLGQLPQLENLYIDGMGGIVEVGHEFYGDCSMCTTTPFPTLKRLRLKKMESLERWLYVDKDRAFPCLEHLEILWCNSLQGDIPPHLPSLKTLQIYECRQLCVLVQFQSLPLLEELQAKKCKIVLESINTTASEGDLKEEHGIMSKPYPQGNSPCELPHLTSLIIKSSTSLISFPNGLLLPALKTLEIKNCEDMESLPSEMPHYTSLKRLVVCNFPKMQCFPEEVLPTNLKHLTLKKLNINQLPLLPSSLSELNVKKIPNLKSISCTSLHKLTKLHAEDCPELEFFEIRALPPQLEELSFLNCPKLQIFLEGGIPLPTNLKMVEIKDVKKLNWGIQASGLHRLHQFQRFALYDVNTEEELSLPSCFSRIHIRGNQNVKNLSVVGNDGTTTTSLTRLDIEDCLNLEFVAGNFTSLTNLSLDGCPNLKGVETREGVGRIIDKPMPIPIPIREWGFHLLTSLKYLMLKEIGGSCTVSCIQGPDDLQLPSSLRRIVIGGFQNLKSIRCSTLPKLKSLIMRRCPHLESESFADSALPRRLQYVMISECDLIKPRLVRDPHGRIRMDDDRWSVR